ncbi:MAG: hybrid sensor histidine kinase/response regulator [Deltaproteobacteria bacterium]|nr:MAG: hybrid sensor histidine kinase/response regulator [Deltaproteobacteria bacterium]
MKVLIVDDRSEDRALLKHYLQRLAEKIVEASDGAEALDLARAETPDLIISDALMPGVDGFELLRRIRKDDRLRAIPFIFYSAVYTGDRDRKLALALGADDFIAKPLEPDAFIRRLRRAMEELPHRSRQTDPKLLQQDEAYLRSYSQMVAARLEEKVAELEQANRRLRMNERRYRNLFNSMRDVVVVATLDRIFLDANQPALRDTFGYETEEIVGRRADILYADREMFELTGREFFDRPEAVPGRILEVRYRRKNGEVFTGELYALKLLDEYGHPVGNIGVIRDITERLHMKQQLLQAQKMESIGTLAGGIAHDFNNILTVIIALGGLTLSKMASNDPLRGNMEEILKAGERAAKLTKELLLFSRRQPMDRKPVDLNGIVHRVETFLGKIIGEDILLSILPYPEPLTVDADSHQLEMVLMNLATNARDAMPGGGRLQITTGRVDFDLDNYASHDVKKPGAYALLTISDSGCGMDEETRQRLFEPFFTTKETGRGTGLGMAVAYGIIEQHDGAIEVISAPEKGTSFRIYLPLTTEEAERRESENSPTSRLEGKETLLLVEDDDMVHNLLANLLREFGYQVLEATNGDEALRRFAAAEGKIDLVVTDLVMPEKGGADIADHIRARYPDMPIVFTTGYAPDALQQRLAALPRTCLLSKPLTPTTLMGAIRTLLDRETNG